MFDIGFWELALIGVIALLVVGPERLPGVARNVGLWVGRIRRYVSHVKQDIERELHAEEVRQLLEKPEGLESIRDVARETASVLDDTRKELDAAAREMTDEDRHLREVPDAVEPAAVPESGAPRVPHHAVDDDPFAPDSIARVAPQPDAVPATPCPPANPDASTPTPDPTPEHEQPGRQGQR